MHVRVKLNNKAKQCSKLEMYYQDSYRLTVKEKGKKAIT